jgi:hypothetical protein
MSLLKIWLKRWLNGEPGWKTQDWDSGLLNTFLA